MLLQPTISKSPYFAMLPKLVCYGHRISTCGYLKLYYMILISCYSVIKVRYTMLFKLVIIINSMSWTVLTCHYLVFININIYIILISWTNKVIKSRNTAFELWYFRVILLNSKSKEKLSKKLCWPNKNKRQPLIHVVLV